MQRRGVGPVITADAFTGKHYAVYGLARSGLATVETLLASGANVTAWDGREEARDKLAALEGLRRNKAPTMGDAGEAPARQSASARLERGRLEIADLDTADLTRFDSLVVTP